MLKMMKCSSLAMRWKSLAVVVLLGALVTVPLSSVSAQSSIFPLDVWTEKGGEGTGVSGGSYGVGETIIIWLHVGLDSQVSWTVAAPGRTAMDSGDLPAGTYSLELGVAEESDIGAWTFEVQAMSGSIVAMDAVEFEVVALQPAAPPPSTGPTQPPATQPSALGQDSATVLDALIALKMAEGSLPIDLGYDVDANGQVTADDARLILRWAVQ